MYHLELNDNLFNSIDKLFNLPLSSNPRQQAPPLNFIERDEEYVATLEVPGYLKEDISLSVESSKLLITGKKSSEREIIRDKDKVLIRESSSTNFSRMVPIPRSVSDDLISASLDDGILTITMPKSPGSINRSIDIK